MTRPFDVERKLAALRLPPSITVRSGNGLHAYWLLTEALTSADIERIEAALRLLADTVGGDVAVCEIARLMRLPGTHNTKQGAFLPVEIATLDGDRRYELDDIEEWLSETSPVILRKTRPAQTPEDNPFLAAAKLLGFKPSIDVEKRLAGMSFMGGGDAAVHQTQLAVSASLLNQAGAESEEVVATFCLARPDAAAGPYGARWNWKREEKAIRAMCEAWVRKASATSPPTEARYANECGPRRRGRVDGTDAAAAARKLAKPAKSNVAVHIVLGEAVIAAVRQRGDDLAFTPKSRMALHGRLVVVGTRRPESAWLDMEIETACRELNIDSTNKVVGEARQWIMRNPTLWREDIKWDAHGKVPCRSGLIDPSTLKVEPPAASHYSTWRIECDYTPLADCPWWTTMINDLFDDRAPTSRAKHIDVVQECLGAALVDIKPRALAKALIFQGGSNFGKSGILEVLGGLFGENQIATPLIALEGSHGLMPFTKRLPWVLHEAFDQGKWHFSSAVKAIITGEPVSINIKNGPMLSQRVKAPIFWGTNSPPQFREATKAIINRMIVIECRREFIEGQPIGAAAEAFKRGYDKPSSLVLTEEMPGLLNWALTGLQRALVRQHIELTDDIRNTSNEIRRDSNLVAGFLEECAGFDPERMVSIPDFCAAFSVWWVENKGEDRRMPSNEAVSKSLIAMSDPRIAINSQELRANSRRYYAGIVLNDQGLGYHKRANEAKAFEGKVASTTANDGVVNSLIPETWNSKASIIAMRSRQGGDGSLNGHFQTVTSTQTVTENLSPVTHVSPALSPTEKSAMSTAPRF
jgi:phage/plasmid-associated DNA primase